jgi:hypothetical protein
MAKVAYSVLKALSESSAFETAVFLSSSFQQEARFAEKARRVD